MDEYFMKLAIELAKKTIGQTSPNPSVGAIVVNEGRIVGIGAHLKAGEAHAEVHALKMAGVHARESTVYVTMEPCSHIGKTGSCAKLLIEKKVKRVVIGTKDPNPLVNGKGTQMLRDSGIDVTVGVLEEEAKKLNVFFNYYIQTKKPFVTIKTAITLDGRIATKTGESKWITGEESRKDAHYYRYIHDAILVGVGTVIKDNPSLTVRLPGVKKNPIRIVLDQDLRIPRDSKILTDGLADTWIITSEQNKNKINQFNCRIIQTQSTRDISTILGMLGEMGLSSILVEGGGEVNASFLKSGFVNQILFYIAPKIFGGLSAVSCFMGQGIQRIEDAAQLEIKSVELVGTDIKVVAIPKQVVR
jgi:diaminohydroxyphosphoribosylaminopyrimidine deaminase / 5-amino-6-(5-phosphoribosylamino)uracil reductase